MKHIGIIVLALLAMSALNGITASSSMAGPCVLVDQEGTGDRDNRSCTGRERAGNYILVRKFIERTPSGQWCAETLIENHGDWGNESCEGRKEVGKFILVQRAPPVWHTAGVKLTQGSRSVKLQNKGTLSLRGEVSGLAVTITCGRSTSNGTIDGQGEARQGQSKDVVKYEQCNVTDGRGGGSCTEPTTITTNQLKAHLARGTFQGEEQIVELFEASTSQQTTSFVNILFRGCSGTLALLSGINAPVTGSVVGVIEPQEEESQEGSLFFPAEPISIIKHEGQEPRVGLLLRGTAATLTGYYGTRLQSGEKFGVFEN